MGDLIRFSAADRNAIRKHVVGKPTGVIVTIGGLDFNLIPATTEQAVEIFELIDTLGPLIANASAKGDVALDQDHWSEIVGKEGKRVTSMLRSVLHDSAVASDLIDTSDAGEEVFNEWFARIPLAESLRTLFPKFVEAQGVSTLLGNDSPPTERTTAGETTSP